MYFDKTTKVSMCLKPVLFPVLTLPTLALFFLQRLYVLIFEQPRLYVLTVYVLIKMIVRWVGHPLGWWRKHLSTWIIMVNQLSYTAWEPPWRHYDVICKQFQVKKDGVTPFGDRHPHFWNTVFWLWTPLYPKRVSRFCSDKESYAINTHQHQDSPHSFSLSPTN